MSDAAFTFRVDEELKKQFMSAAKEREQTGAQLLREFMLDYVQRQHSAADLKFRQQVEAGIASANAGNLVAAQDVEARFSAKREAARTRLKIAK